MAGVQDQQVKEKAEEDWEKNLGTGRKESIDKKLNEKLTAKLDIDDLGETYAELIGAAGSWEKFVLALKVPEGEKETIKRNRFFQVDDCLMDGLSYWLRGNTKSTVNWQTILTALKDPTVKQSEHAEKIEKKFRKAINDKM